MNSEPVVIVSAARTPIGKFENEMRDSSSGTWNQRFLVYTRTRWTVLVYQ